jgi:quercetin dioxygenase-like cupin family protein
MSDQLRRVKRRKRSGGISMNRIYLLTSLFIGSLSFAAVAPVAAIAADDHMAVSPEQLKWVAPAQLPKGAEMAVVADDPSKEAPYVIRLRIPSGLKFPAHSHPNDESLTVLSGTFHFSMGNKFDENKGEALKAGGFVQASKGMNHYGWSSEDTVVQLHGIGPFGITYVDPADDPSKTN